MARKPIEEHMRRGAQVPNGSLLLRGSPLTLGQLEHDAERTARRFTFDDVPCHGISVELAVDNEDVDRLLREGRVRNREFVARILTADLTGDGFIVLPTFLAPTRR